MFIFALLCSVSKGFMKALKPFEAQQKSMKIKIQVNFCNTTF